MQYIYICVYSKLLMFSPDGLFLCWYFQKVEELEGARCAQQRQQDAALATLHTSLTEECRAELKQQRKHMEQVREHTHTHTLLQHVCC